MPLPRQIFAPAFRHRRIGWFFTLLVGIMVYLASFATAAEATLSAATFTWDTDMASRMTIEIPAADEDSHATQEERVREALAVVRAVPDVEAAKAVSTEETLRLLQPWIGQPELLKSLPIPSLIDVERTRGSTLSAVDIEAKIKGVVADARVDDHGAWLSDLSHLTRGLAALGLLVIVLTGVSLIIAVSLLCRAIMATEHDAIRLLHVMGAEDVDIARHFQFHARRMATPAAIAGFFLAICSAGGLLFFVRHLADLSSLHMVHWLALAGIVLPVPLAAIGIAALSARLSVLRLLQGST